MIKEEVYAEDPKGFKESHFLDHVIWLRKSLYCFKQALLAWYEQLATFSFSIMGFKEVVATRLFIHRGKEEIVIIKVYIHDIIFGSTKDNLA